MVDDQADMFRIYYHLYLGASWSAVWEIHRPFLIRFAESGLLERLIVCICGAQDVDLGMGSLKNVEVRRVAVRMEKSNEFHTLREMHVDAGERSAAFSYCVYMHSKGSSSQWLSSGAAEWSLFLATAMFGSLGGFAQIVKSGFNASGSNLALGIFEDFGLPRLHYSGNFWCATRELIASAPSVELGERHAAIRHNAEWWLSLGSSFTPFNLFSTGVDHYSDARGLIDWRRLESRLVSTTCTDFNASGSMERIRFLRVMIERATGTSMRRRAIASYLLRSLPHHRLRRLLNVHDVLMRTLGSRKSAYFYCAET